MHYLWPVLVVCLLHFSTILHGQSSYVFGTMPHINIGTSLAQAWKLNSKIETRQIFVTGDSQGSETNIAFERVDIATVVSRKTGSGKSFGVGYLIRFTDHTLAHRAIQQYAFNTGYGLSKIAHRLSADQTFRSAESPVFRLRYRLGLEIPLNGQSIDPNELYLKLNNEYIGILQHDEEDIEIRASAVIGLYLNDNNKVETGIDYRVSELLLDGAAHQVWITFGGFFSL